MAAIPICQAVLPYGQVSLCLHFPIYKIINLFPALCSGTCCQPRGAAAPQTPSHATKRGGRWLAGPKLLTESCQPRGVCTGLCIALPVGAEPRAAATSHCWSVLGSLLGPVEEQLAERGFKMPPTTCMQTGECRQQHGQAWNN